MLTLSEWLKVARSLVVFRLRRGKISARLASSIERATRRRASADGSTCSWTTASLPNCSAACSMSMAGRWPCFAAQWTDAADDCVQEALIELARQRRAAGQPGGVAVSRGPQPGDQPVSLGAAARAARAAGRAVAAAATARADRRADRRAEELAAALESLPDELREVDRRPHLGRTEL